MRGKKAFSLLLGVLCVVSIVVACLFGYWMYRQISLQEKEEVTPFAGTISLTVQEDNYLSRGTAVTSTSDSYVAYHSKGKALADATKEDFVSGITFTVGTAKDVSVETVDLGHLWFKAYTGTDYFLHVEGTIEANPVIMTADGSKFLDLDNDNRLEVVFDVDLSREIADPKQSKDIVVMCVQEDTSLALNTPADQTGIGSGTKTGTIEWQITGCSEKYGFRLARLYVTSNETTFESLCKVTSVNIAQVGTFTGSAIKSDSGAKTWYIDIGISDYRELVYSYLLMRSSGGTSYVAVTVSWETYFTGAQAVTLTLKLEPIGADEAVDTALSDAVILKQA